MSSNANNNDNAAAPRIDSVKRVSSTKFLALDTYNWTDQDGRQRQWDVAVRTTTAASNTADAVVIIPILRSKSNPGGQMETLLVEQFRPPLAQATLEFPAGLIDEGELIDNAALRELREETGYVGEKCSTPPEISRAVCMSPGMSSEKVHVVVVQVDLDNPYNHGTPKPQLDEGEHCKVIRLPLTEGIKKRLDDENNAMPIMGLYLFALGLELGATLNKE
jgi:8-oxo-dGTP pyrophosphatase MutT (NUDIX family)